MSHVTYIVEILNSDGEREFFSDWFHSHFDGALGFRCTFTEPGDYTLKIRPEPTMPGMRTQQRSRRRPSRCPCTWKPPPKRPSAWT